MFKLGIADAENELTPFSSDTSGYFSLHVFYAGVHAGIFMESIPLSGNGYRSRRQNGIGSQFYYLQAHVQTPVSVVYGLPGK